MKKVCNGIAALAMIVISVGASAADIGHGENLAKDWCSNCHLVTSDQTSGGDSAPTFGSIAETSAERNSDLRAWLADPHPPMPNLNLTVREIDDLLAYIESLRDR
ncbi:MAG: c-type cytochrome [Geminicoccaceae bacterium]